MTQQPPNDPTPAPEAGRYDAEHMQRVIDSILATVPPEHPRDVYDFPDECYDAYREGQKSILWVLASEIRKAPRP